MFVCLGSVSFYVMFLFCFFSDKVLSAAMMFSGTLLKQLCSSIQDDLQHCEGTRRFMEVVGQLTSHMETDSDILLSCAEALELNFRYLSNST